MWQDQFDDRILERGWDYYREDRVHIIERDENKILALVDGSDISSYEVKIELSNDAIIDMTCTCPYTEDFNNCKHMAAVLYATSKPLGDLASADQSLDSLQKIILAMSEKDAKNLLLSEAQENPILCTHIWNTYGNRSLDTSDLRHKIAAIKQRYSDRYGFIDYYHASNYARDLENFMDTYVSSMLTTQEYRPAFQLVCNVYHSLGELDIDDSNGEITELADSCLLYWQEIIDKCNSDDTEFFFGWFKEHLYDYTADYLQCYIDDFFIDNFHDPDMLKEKLKVLDVLIAKAATKPEDEFLLSFNLENYVMKRLRVMEELRNSEDEITAFCQEYYRLPNVRSFIIQHLLGKNKITEAIMILKQSKLIDHAFPESVAQASEQLIALYQQTGQNLLHQQELEYYIQNCQQRNLDYVVLLKQFYDKQEWKKKRQDLLTYPTLLGVRDEFMIREKLYDKFLTHIRDSLQQPPYDNEVAISILDRYENVLAAQKPEAVRDLYIDFVRESSKCTSSRIHYQTLTKYLKKIKRYPKGDQLVKQIVSEWRSLYPRRRAMMEELNQAGF